jgi:hypothetical protein
MAEANVASRKGSAAVGMVPGTGVEGLFTHPWPGPGNSEGPVDPDRWSFEPAGGSYSDGSGTSLAASPWPGQ